jgi:Ca-activated chloride channel homolog
MAAVRVLAGIVLLLIPSRAETVRVNNPYGSVIVRVVTGSEIRVRRSSPGRPVRADDAQITRTPGVIAVDCRPADGAPVDIGIELTYGSTIEATTQNGAVSLEGLIARAFVKTAGGDIQLTAPWEATRLSISSRDAPKGFEAPKGLKLSRRTQDGAWLLEDGLPESRVTYGAIRVEAESAGRIVLSELPIPADSPVKLHWQAPEILDGILTGGLRNKAPSSRAPINPPKPAASAEPGTPLFTSDVRMVNVAVAVSDGEGRHVAGLKPEDFQVLEDGAPQKPAIAGSEEVPFNLAILLDLSGSTLRNRPAMKEAARRFVEIARPQDRVAVYALASDLFHVVSRLTADRAPLLATIEAIPEVSGGSPLYDTVVLAYAEEFLQRPEERNALIVISDGVDNQIQGVLTPSKVSFRKLQRAAAEMNALIYPVYLDPFTVEPPPRWALSARSALEKLAGATGGRLFRTSSIHDLDPVYPQVAEELRSVYTVAYYPANQKFDGKWRRVVVRVNRPGAKVRTRSGYFAR